MTVTVHYATYSPLESGFDEQSTEGIMPVEGESPESILRDVLSFLLKTHPAPYMVVGLRHETQPNPI